MGQFSPRPRKLQDPIRTAWRQAHRGMLFLRESSLRIGSIRDWKSIAIEITVCAVPELGDACILVVTPPDGEPFVSSQSILSEDRVALIGEKLRDSVGLREILRLGKWQSGRVTLLRTADTEWGYLLCANSSPRKPQGTPLFQSFSALVAILLESAWRREQSRSAIRARDEFLITASHELKTPLTTLRLQTYTLRKLIERSKPTGPIGETAPRVLDLLDRQTSRLESRIDDFLEAARARTGKFDLTRTTTELGEVVRRTLEKHRLEFEHANCETHVVFDSTLVGDWDSVRIGQALSNILSNAIKFGRSAPITIHVYRDAGMGCVSIQDHGIGISQADQKRILQAFERAVSAVDFSGLGIGLFVSRRIIEAHGGTIEVRSHPTHGAEFIVRLPLLQDFRAESIPRDPSVREPGRVSESPPGPA